MGSEAAERSADDGDLSEVGEIWLGGSVSVPGEEFVAALEMVEDFQLALREVKDEMDEMNVGLDRNDTEDLLYGRNSKLTKSQIRAAFEVMDAVITEDPQDLAPRLLADQTSELTIAEAAEVWGDMVDLAEKYGALNEENEDTQ